MHCYQGESREDAEEAGVSATRLMVLGVVRMQGRTHGYQVRRELLSWNADKWGNIKPGSIYHALKKMAAQGLLREVDPETGTGPDRTTYELTGDGDREFLDLLTASLAESRDDTQGGADFQAAVAFLPCLQRAMAVSLLGHRRTRLEGQRAAIADATERSTEWGQPAHIGSLYRMWAGQLDASIEWTSDEIRRLESGELVMADDEEASFGAPPAKTAGSDAKR